MEHEERGITNEGCIYEDKIEFRKNNEITILDFYSNQYIHSTREIWKQRILEGQIQVNGEVIQDPNTKITKKMGGKTIRYFRYLKLQLFFLKKHCFSPSWQEPIVETIPKFFKDIILYENEQLVVLNKPSGLPVLPSGKSLLLYFCLLKNSKGNYLETNLLKMLHKFYKENGYQVDFNQVAPVHRLGRGTSGSILFCKTKHAGNKLGYAMKNHNIKKTYLALACNFKSLLTKFTSKLEFAKKIIFLLIILLVQCLMKLLQQQVLFLQQAKMENLLFLIVK
jgi:23S rRNA pseudouridine1911/1915/1917 synthase